MAVTLITGGKLGDRFGRKRVFLAGVVGFSLSSLACGLSGSVGMLVAFRVAQGAFGALLLPATLAILRATFPPERLQQAVGIWAGTSAVALAAGPIVGGLLVEHVSWQSVFLINVSLGAVAVGVGLWVIRDSRDESSGRHFDLPGVALLSGALFTLVWGIIKSQVHGWGSAYTLGFLAAAGVLLAAFVVRARGTAHPLIPLDLFRSRSLSAAMVLLSLVTFALFEVIFFLTLYLQRVHGYTPVGAGVRMLPLTAVIAFSAPIGGTVVGKVGPRVPTRSSPRASRRCATACLPRSPTGSRRAAMRRSPAGWTSRCSWAGPRRSSGR